MLIPIWLLNVTSISNRRKLLSFTKKRPYKQKSNRIFWKWSSTSNSTRFSRSNGRLKKASESTPCANLSTSWKSPSCVKHQPGYLFTSKLTIRSECHQQLMTLSLNWQRISTWSKDAKNLSEKWQSWSRRMIQSCLLKFWSCSRKLMIVRANLSVRSSSIRWLSDSWKSSEVTHKRWNRR